MSDGMGYIADDWEIALIGGAGFGRGGAASIYMAIFQSKKAGVTEPFYFAGTGVGIGGNLSGFDPNLMKEVSFSGVNVVTPFSAVALHQSAGLLASAAIDLTFGKAGKALAGRAGYGIARVNAGRDGTTYFEHTPAGVSLGSGNGVNFLAGIWYSHKLNAGSPNPVPSYLESARKSVTTLLDSWVNGIEQLYNRRGN